MDWALRFLISATLLAVNGCAGSRVHLPDPDLRADLEVTRIDGETLLVLKEGNLAPVLANSSQERVSLFSSFLVDNRTYFGAGRDGEISFMAVTPEDVVTWHDGDSFTMVALHQVHKGARVIDEVQYGAYRLDDPGKAGELRRVRARLHDPAGLPDPITPTPELREKAEGDFQKFLTTRGMTMHGAIVEEHPVISVRLRMSGYYGRAFQVNADKGCTELAALINPDSREIGVLYDIRSCGDHWLAEGAPDSAVGGVQ